MSDIKPQDSFVSLHSHTALGSMLDAMNNVDLMFKRAAEIGQPALAITDHGTMAATHDARKASVKHGVKYIPGIEAYFVSTIKDLKEKRKHIVLLAKNEIGYKNLLRLNYEGYVNNVYVAVQNKIYPRIDWEMLQKYNEGVICLTACGSGLISRQMFITDEDGIWKQDACHVNVMETISKLKGIFGDDLYLEIQPHNLKIFDRERKTGEIKLNKDGQPIVIVDQNHINRILLRAAKELKVNVAATVDAHYLTKEDAKPHDMLMAISSKAPLADKLRHRYEVEEFYMKTRKEVEGHFTKYFNENVAKKVCDATVEIANKCEEPVYLDNKGVRFPVFDCKSEPDYIDFQKWYAEQKFYNTIKEDHAFLRYRSIIAFQRQFKHLKGEERKVYVDRIKKEMEVLEMHNFCSYILVVADFISWAKNQDVLSVGAGRGSVAGSLIAYLLGIHSVNPIQYNLLFERFHNKEKKSYPDIDTDFHPEWREKVEHYIINKYGKDKVAHVSNLSTMTPKVIVKDIARSLELGGDKSAAFKIANAITDTIPATAKTIDEALRDSKEFAKACAKYPELESYGRKLVGLEKAYATHAAGVVISDIDLSTYVPLRVDKDGTVAVQYEKNRCEENGLIKMDLLGLDHLRILSDAIANARALGFDCPNTVPNFEDARVWDEMCKGRTLCMFQLESDLMKDLCKRVKPRNIEDLAVINALNRPSLAAWRTPYINRRHGLEKVIFKYKCLEKCLSKTLGICVFEEQLMGLASDVAGWDLNKADGLRKLTKLKEKGGGLADKLQDEFIKDAMQHSNLSKEDATDIWISNISEFAKYGFNKSLGYLELIDIYDKNENFMFTKSMEDIYKDKNKAYYVKSRDEKTKADIIAPLKDIHDHGVIDVYELEMEDGRKVVCTLDHKFRVMDGRMLTVKQIIDEGLEIASM